MTSLDEKLTRKDLIKSGLGSTIGTIALLSKEPSLYFVSALCYAYSIALTIGYVHQQYKELKGFGK